jgi:type I restriction enzyme S subunit
VKAGWNIKHLDQVARFCGGGTPSKSNASFWNGNIPWISPKDMWVDQITASTDMISEEAVRSSATTLIPAGAVLCVVRSGILARKFPVAITRREVAINQDLKAIVPSKSLISEYLFYFLKASETEVLASVTTGATVHRLSTDLLRSMAMPVPPLDEQRRIVAVLDKAFAGIATATANAQKNLTSARALFEAALGSAFDECAEISEIRRISDIAKVSYGYTEKASFERIGPHFLRITDIQDGGVDWKAVPFCKVDAKDFSKYSLTSGDIVFARTGATTGKSYLINNPPKAVCASYLIRLRVTLSNFDSEYVQFFFQTPAYWESVKAGISGSAPGGFNASKLSELEIPFPPIAMQKTLVIKLRLLQEMQRKVEGIYHAKLAALAELKQSLLQKAFAGDLT